MIFLYYINLYNMHLEKIYVQNYYSYKHYTEIKDIKNINYFIGSNGSGKSNLQKCFGMFYNMFQKYQIDHKNSTYNMDENTELLIGFVLNLEQDEFKKYATPYRKFDNIDVQKISIEKLFKNSSPISEKLVFTNKDGAKNVFTKKNGDIHTISPNEYFNRNYNIMPSDPNSTILNVAAYLENFFTDLYKELMSFFTITKMQNDRKVNPVGTIMDDIPEWINGEHYTSYIMKLIIERGEKLNRYIDSIRTLSDKHILDISLDLTKSNSTNLKIHMNDLPNPLGFNQLSSGEKMVLLFALLKEHDGKILCIEEPELHLHSKFQKKLCDIIKKIPENTSKQIFIETHSPIFTGCGKHESTYLTHKFESISHITPINDSNIDIIKQELGITYADIFDYDYIIIVEGKTEKAAYSKIKKRFEYAKNKRVNCLVLDGIHEVYHLRSLLKYFQKSNREILIILDNHDKVDNVKSKLIQQGLIKNNNFVVLSNSFEDTFDKKFILAMIKKIYGEKFGNEISEELFSSENMSKVINERHPLGKKIDKVILGKALISNISDQDANSNEFIMPIKNFFYKS